MSTKNRNNLHRLQQLLLKIPYGRVTTYKLIACAMGTRSCRYIGQLLKRNPDPDQYPCFKVVRSDGSVGGYSRGVKEKVQRLREEGVQVKNGKVKDFERIKFILNS